MFTLKLSLRCNSNNNNNNKTCEQKSLNVNYGSVYNLNASMMKKLQSTSSKNGLCSDVGDILL